MGRHFKGKPEQVRALDAYTKLMRAANSVTAELSHEADRSGLSSTQFAVLEALYHVGPLRQCELAVKLLKSGANITNVVDNLEGRGLIVRRKDITDRRNTTIELTGEGRKLIADVFPSHANFITQQFSALDPDEQATLGRLCRKLGLAVSKKN
jgi:MarR family transcriptional regulator, 2-MHQ and catechol-resistance regulon repressor